MENSRGAAGVLDAAGTWTPAAHPVTEFCTDGNHDPDGDTQQEIRNHDSCWETIKTRAGFTTLTVPNPAVARPDDRARPPPTGSCSRSSCASRSSSTARARWPAATRWPTPSTVRSTGSSTARSGRICSRSSPTTTRSTRRSRQTQVSALGGLGGTTAAINALTPRGATDIRDALFRARDQIESLPTRAAVQVVVLLTDGVHNSPSGLVAARGACPTCRRAASCLRARRGQPGRCRHGPARRAGSRHGRALLRRGRQPAEPDREQDGGDQRRGARRDHHDRADPVPRQPLGRRRQGDRVRRRRPIEPAAPPNGSGGCSTRSGSRTSTGSTRRRQVVVRPDGRRYPSTSRTAPTGRASRSRTRTPSTSGSTSSIRAGALVDTSPGGSATQVASSAPHEFIVVEHPDPGRWTLVAVRVAPEPHSRGTSSRGARTGTSRCSRALRRSTRRGGPVPITATARWGHELTGLRARAVVTAPSGARRPSSGSPDVPSARSSPRVARLSDDRAVEPAL